jgi:hypothetical protein
MRESGDQMGDTSDAEVEMPEYGHLLEDKDVEQPGFHYQAPKRRALPPWLLRGAVILVFVILLSDNIRLRLGQSPESAFATDLSKFTSITLGSPSILSSCNNTATAKHLSELVEYRFTGGIQVDHEGKLYREINPMEPQYAGEPSPEIDKAWDDLLSG